MALGTTAAILTGLGMAGASTAAGALSNRAKKQTSNSSYNNTSTTTPNLTPEMQSLYSLMAGNVSNRLQGQTPLQGYEATGLQNINSTSDAIGNSIRNRLVASGTYGSPNASTALNNLDVSRGTQAAQFRNSIPMLQNSLDLQNLGAAGTVFGLGPQGSTTTRSGTGQDVTNYPGNVAGGALGGLGGALGFLIGQGAFGPMSNPGGSGGQSSGNPLSSMGIPGGYGSPLAPAGARPPGGIDMAALLRALGGLT